MSATFHFDGTVAGQAVGPSTTCFFGVYDGFLLQAAAEAEAQSAWRTATILSNFYRRIDTNTLSATATFTIRVNGADATQTFTVGAGATGEFEDTTHTDTISVGDLVCMKVVTGAGGTSLITRAGGIMATGTPPVIKYGWGSGSSVAIETYGYFTRGNPGVVGNARFDVRAAGTLKNLFVNVTVNTCSATSFYFSQKTGSGDGNVQLAIGAGATGVFEDTSHTDTLALGDDWHWHVAPGTGSLTPALQTWEVIPDTSYFVQSTNAAGLALTASSTGYCGLGHINTITTESQNQIAAHQAARFSKLCANATANAASGGNSTIRFRVNGANVNNLLTIGASATGYFEDTSDTDDVVAADQLCYQVIIASGGSLTWTLVGGVITPSVAAAASGAKIIFRNRAYV